MDAISELVKGIFLRHEIDPGYSDSEIKLTKLFSNGDLESIGNELETHLGVQIPDKILRGSCRKLRDYLNRRKDKIMK